MVLLAIRETRSTELIRTSNLSSVFAPQLDFSFLCMPPPYEMQIESCLEGELLRCQEFWKQLLRMETSAMRSSPISQTLESSHLQLGIVLMDQETPIRSLVGSSIDTHIQLKMRHSLHRQFVLPLLLLTVEIQPFSFGSYLARGLNQQNVWVLLQIIEVALEILYRES